ncbi:MAG: amino acid adenylation protein [Acidobacteria bacterium]|nr:MAG: amino acid adenylation protein [Acidobacteriota bacterium]
MHHQDPATEMPLPSPEWNETLRHYPRDSCVHRLFEDQAERRTQSVAAAFEDQRFTYQELNCRSNQLARYLRKRGVGPDVLVGLCVERSLDMVVGLLGILKAGGAYVPLDPAYPKDRIAYIMEDARAPVLLTQQKLLPGLPRPQAEVVLLDAHWSSIAKEDSDNPAPKAKAENLAYVIYTSGSTGKPKGVQLEHRSVVNFLCTMQTEPGLAETDVVAAVTTLCFDIAGLEIYLPLVTGAQVVVISRDEAADGKKLQARMQKAGVTVMQATPATWRLLLEADWPGNDKLKILCGGEALPRELANKLLPRCRSLWNMYGPTETTIWSAVYKVTAGGEGTVPIGHPIGNTQFYIVDEQMNQLPVGQEGQLLIGGDGLARGYQNRADLTKEKFILDPFRSQPEARLYQTGDLARYLPDGTIAFLGRMDQQVKIRGYRIELGEIESVLATHPSVHHTVVKAREDTPGDRRLVAYIVPTRDQRPMTHILREFLKAQLPDYMIPSAFVVLDAMPLTPNGKMDHKQLPPPTRENSAIEPEFVAPRDRLETELVHIWESILGIKPIGITDNIFDLGVNSLIAAQLFARIEKTLGKDLPPAPLFQAPTVESLATLLRQNTTRSRRTSLVAIQPQGSKTPLFCVHGGAGTVLLFHSLARQLVPDRPVYGLQSQGLYGRDFPHTDVEKMAAHYVEEMRTVQPHGPYLLSGWCFGGLVAFEMAQQLHRMGEWVDLLAMLNAPSTPDYQPLNTDPGPVILPLAVRLQKHWRELTSLPGAERIKYVSQKLRGGLIWRRQGLRRRVIFLTFRATVPIRHLVYRFYVQRRRPLPDFLRNSCFLYINARAERCYQHHEYPGSTVVFRDQGPYPDPYLGWGRFVRGQIEAYEIPVSVRDHRGLMQEPAVAILAQKMQEYLGRKEVLVSQGYIETRAGEGVVSSGQAFEPNIVQ